MNKYEIIKYKNEEFQLDVSISPEEDTVWLSLKDMCLLFGRDKSVISRHIKTVIKENHLDVQQVVAKNATTGLDGKTYNVLYYNLEVIIPVGYSVKSQNGIIFRRWANKVLKEYLIKGFLINDNRSLISNENLESLSKRVIALENKVSDMNKSLRLFKPNEKVFIENQTYTAYLYINKLLREAEKRIIIIDGYLDDSSLEFFSNVNQNIEIALITHKINRIREHVLRRFKEEFVNVEIIENKSLHDRFIIVDEAVYSLGTSLNNLGKKLTTIHLMENTNPNDVVTNILKKKNS